jgi:hypothetical protein
MRWGFAVAAVTVWFLTITEARATLPVGSCEVVECRDGRIFCSPNADPGESQNGSGAGAIAVQCSSRIVDLPCNEIAACHSHVPLMGSSSLFALVLVLTGAGGFFLKRR